MVVGRSVVTRLAFVAGALGLSATGAGAQSAPHVNAAVQVTTNPVSARGHAIPVIAVHPRNDRVVALAEAETRSSRCSIHVSTDGGASWSQGASPQPASAPRCVRNTEGPISDARVRP
jgi:hypothetical protein